MAMWITYNGGEQSPSWNSYNPETLTLGGTTTATNAGTYTATFTPKGKYKWTDGTQTPKQITWTINRATVSVPSQSGSLTYTGSTQSPTWAGYDDAGKLTLKNINSMKLNLLIDEETGETFDYSSSIDEQTYNTISHGHPVTDTYTGGGTAEDVDHNHPIKGLKKFKVHNALVVGDRVVMARIQKGKKFLVLDRIAPNPALKGEWV